MPCWSSCITGISSDCLSFLSISKQRGALISSKLIAPESWRNTLDDPHDFVRVLRIDTDRPGVDIRQLFKEHHLAFHDRESRLRTEIAHPNTADPSETTATLLLLLVKVKTFDLSFAIA